MSQEVVRTVEEGLHRVVNFQMYLENAVNGRS